MNRLQTDEKIQLANALQISLSSAIAELKENADGVVVHFTEAPERNEQLQDFEQLFPGAWINSTQYVSPALAENSDEIIGYLYLTRLRRENMRHLAALAPHYAKYWQRLDASDQAGHAIASLSLLSSTIFQTVQQQNLTMRELSERTGITQAALSRFKHGGDTRVSTVLKILQALSLQLTIQS